MTKYTFFYVVGGSDMYYDQLKRSINSLSRLNVEYKIKILDFDRKLSNHKNIEIVYSDKTVNQKHIFWQYKYFITQQLDTEYGIYLDCDTIIYKDRVEEIFYELKDKFGVVQHFYLDNFKKFIRSFPYKESHDFINNSSLL